MSKNIVLYALKIGISSGSSVFTKKSVKDFQSTKVLFGPRRDKTCLRGFPTKRDSNQSLHLQRLVRKLKFRLQQA